MCPGKANGCDYACCKDKGSVENVNKSQSAWLELRLFFTILGEFVCNCVYTPGQQPLAAHFTQKEREREREKRQIERVTSRHFGHRIFGICFWFMAPTLFTFPVLKAPVRRLLGGSSGSPNGPTTAIRYDPQSGEHRFLVRHENKIKLLANS